MALLSGNCLDEQDSAADWAALSLPRLSLALARPVSDPSTETRFLAPHPYPGALFCGWAFKKLVKGCALDIPPNSGGIWEPEVRLPPPGFF